MIRFQGNHYIQQTMPWEFVHREIGSCWRLKESLSVYSRNVGLTLRYIFKRQPILSARFATVAAVKIAEKKPIEEHKVAKGSKRQGLHDVKGVFSQAQVRATFYPKFENEKSDQEVRLRMIDVVDSGKGVLEVTLKHSGSLFMYAGHHGGAFAKNSYGNLYSAVGVFVLGRTLQEAWGSEAAAKQREFNAYLETHKLCISMELVTAVLGDHGQRPLKDYVVVTAVSDLKNKPRFFSTSDIIAFCRKWRLPTNDVWLFSTRKSAAAFFAAYDALSEDGTATPVNKVLNGIADISVQAAKSHMEVQGEILEGLVARIVNPSSLERLKSVLKEVPLAVTKAQQELQPTLREICLSKNATEDEQIKALLKAVGISMCSDYSDWNAKLPDPSLFNKFMSSKPVDSMTGKLQEMIQLLRERHMQARYPCRVKEFDREEGKIQFRLTIHILSDMVFRNYQKEMRRSPGLWPLYRGFFVDICLFDEIDQYETSQLTKEHEVFVEDDALADETEHLMLKLKFLTYKLRTFLIRNGLSTLFESGFAAYRKYYLRLMDIWGTSASKREQLDQMLTEWAGYITQKCHGIQLEERSYLTEAEPFLKRFAERSPQNSQLVGAAAKEIKADEFLSKLSTQTDEDLYDDVSKADLLPNEPVKAKGLLVFFPGIPGCAKSALCRALLENQGGLGIGKPMQSLMGDMTKGRYWDKLSEERRRNPSVITLADKNAPNEEIWTTVARMCRDTQAIGVPVVPDSEGTTSNPFCLEILAVFMFRVLQRVNHPATMRRWTWMHRPIHGFAGLLHPAFKSTRLYDDVELLSDRLQYMSRVVPTHLHNDMLEQINCYMDERGNPAFLFPTCWDRESMVKPLFWWQNFGFAFTTLFTYALKVLSQDCSSGACERNWSAFSLIHTKVRNRLSPHQMEKLIYCRTNLKMLQNIPNMETLKQMNVDKFWPSVKDTPLPSHDVPQDEEELLFADLYRELCSIDVRQTRGHSRRRVRGVRGRGKGLIIRRASTTSHGDGASTSRAPASTYTRRQRSTLSSLQQLPLSPRFDDEGNLISDPPTPPSSTYEMTSSDSLDENSDDSDIDEMDDE
ncbi:hypothetical protein KP509_19G059600 [Ceratopteris richardii]|nr:hypothetical protein KP509_19G059600 [Ceratopteris richardii]